MFNWKILLVLFILFSTALLYFLVFKRSAEKKEKTVKKVEETKDDKQLASVKPDRVLVIKSERLLHLLKDGKIIKTYKVSLGADPVGHKVCQGDNKTPEGVYMIDSKNPNSKFHLNLGISYPNEIDKACAERLGKSPGGDIKIHGLRKGWENLGQGHLIKNWTAGCIAVTNEEIEEIYRLVEVGTPIEIRP